MVRDGEARWCAASMSPSEGGDKYQMIINVWEEGRVEQRFIRVTSFTLLKLTCQWKEYLLSDVNWGTHGHQRSFVTRLLGKRSRQLPPVSMDTTTASVTGAVAAKEAWMARLMAATTLLSSGHNKFKDGENVDAIGTVSSPWCRDNRVDCIVLNFVNERTKIWVDASKLFGSSELKTISRSSNTSRS